jgi:hypothetical protein
MKDKGCNGICERHPNKTKTKLDYRTFNKLKDAICRNCGVYFRNLSDSRCPCCKRILSRTIRRVSKIQIDALVQYAFTNFWKMVYRDIHRKFTRVKKKLGRKPKGDYPNRTCTECSSTETYVYNGKYPQWYFVNNGWKCNRCGMRIKRYWKEKEIIPIEIPRNC